MTDPRYAPRKSSTSSYNGNSVVVNIERGTSMSGWGDLVAAHSNLPGLEHFIMLATPAEWRAFVDGVKAGEFDLDADGLLPPVPARAE